MEAILLQLLEELERLGESHEELYDSEVREQMGNAIMEGYVRQANDFLLPDEFGMFSSTANLAVKQLLRQYINDANAAAKSKHLNSFHSRLAAFQNANVRTVSDVAVDYEDFFGHTPPDWYDESGNVLWDRVR